MGGSSQKSGELSEKQVLTISDLEDGFPKKVGSSSQKSGELLKKRSRILLSSLLLTLVPVNIETMVGTLGYKSKDRFRDDYLKPLKNNGLINYTIPGKANDPDQAYLITQRGKDFLGGNLIT